MIINVWLLEKLLANSPNAEGVKTVDSHTYDEGVIGYSVRYSVVKEIPNSETKSGIRTHKYLKEKHVLLAKCVKL